MKATEEKIRIAKEYIHNHLGDYDLSHEKVAEHIGVSTYTFRRIFFAAEGILFSKYVTEQRIKTAEMLLISTDLEIAAVGNAVGYIDPHYFSKVFKMHNNLSPTKYREKYQSHNRF